MTMIFANKSTHQKVIDKYNLIYQKFIDHTKTNEEVEITKAFIKQLFELDSLKELYFKVHIPAATKTDKKIQSTSELAFTSTRIETQEATTIRHAYVALYHQFETFCQDMKRYLCETDNTKGEKDQFEIYCKEYGLTVNKDGYIYVECESLSEIKWICNRTKHDNGYPKATNIPFRYSLRYLTIDRKEKIKVDKDMLMEHFEFIKDYFEFISNITLNLKILFYQRNLKPINPSDPATIVFLDLNKATQDNIKGRIELYKHL